MRAFDVQAGIVNVLQHPGIFRLCVMTRDGLGPAKLRTGGPQVGKALSGGLYIRSAAKCSIVSAC
jgi:hypothetical protein